MTIQTENTYYIEIYMNIDIDGYDLTIFVYHYSQKRLVYVSEAFAY